MKLLDRSCIKMEIICTKIRLYSYSCNLIIDFMNLNFYVETFKFEILGIAILIIFLNLIYGNR